MFNTRTTNYTVYTECLNKYTLEPLSKPRELETTITLGDLVHEIL